MMKDTHFLSSIATLALGSIIVIFVSFATGNLPKQTPRAVAPSTVSTPAAKNCVCCAKITSEELAALEIIKQYGLEEGLPRIKQSHPKIAEQLEHFIEKYTVAKEN